MYVPCRIFPWSDIIKLLDMLNLEAFLFGVDSRIHPTTEFEIQSFAAEFDSQTRLSYLKFFSTLLSKLEKKDRLNVRLFVPSGYPLTLIKNLQFGTFFAYENADLHEKSLRMNAQPSESYLYVEDTDGDHEILKSRETDSSLQSLSCTFRENRLSSPSVKYFKTAKVYTPCYLILRGLMNRKVTHTTTTRTAMLTILISSSVGSVFSEIATSTSLRILKNSHVQCLFHSKSFGESVGKKYEYKGTCVFRNPRRIFRRNVGDKSAAFTQRDSKKPLESNKSNIQRYSWLLCVSTRYLPTWN
ncbi:hypothetical protein HK098_002609 [Nowakowskiella sp. JEL0407]|nr:hypothetical protein HK098_002609 [Nowakowskiella sp. JEL0407]